MDDAVDISEVDDGDTLCWEGFISLIVNELTDEVDVAIVEESVRFHPPVEDTSEFTDGKLLYVEEVSNLETEYPVFFGKYKAGLLHSHMYFSEYFGYVNEKEEDFKFSEGIFQRLPDLLLSRLSGEKMEAAEAKWRKGCGSVKGQSLR